VIRALGSNRDTDRLPLDALVRRVRDPVFRSRHRRQPSMRATSRHVNPVMLAACTADSLYLREWRKHARRCAACARVFAHFGLALE
jgi:hypothetical protein